MDRFVSNFTNRLDAKGRVSIPATFRAVLARDGHEGLYVHPALDTPAMDAGGNALLAEIDAFMSTRPPYSDEWDQLSLALLGSSEVIRIDGEGRISLTESVKVHAGIADEVTFVGLGHKFQMWRPARFRARLEEARARAGELKRGLGETGTANLSPGARDR